MKKSLLQITALFRRPKYIHPDFTYPVAMLEVDEKANNLSGSLGISDDRAKYLLKLLHQRMLNNEKLHVMMIELSKECKHANELAYVAHHFGSCPAMLVKNSIIAIIPDQA